MWDDGVGGVDGFELGFEVSDGLPDTFLFGFCVALDVEHFLHGGEAGLLCGLDLVDLSLGLGDVVSETLEVGLGVGDGGGQVVDFCREGCDGLALGLELFLDANGVQLAGQGVDDGVWVVPHCVWDEDDVVGVVLGLWVGHGFDSEVGEEGSEDGENRRGRGGGRVDDLCVL